MASIAELIIRLEGQDKVSGVLKGVKEETGGLSKSLGNVTTVATGFMAAQGAGALVGFLGSAANAAAEDAASVERLKMAYENANGPAATFTSWMEGAVQTGQDLAFSDDQIRDSLSLLTAQTSSAEEAQKRLALAQDLSRGANIDLVTASKLLGKVTDENVNVLARYGIKAKEGMDQTELFGMIQEKFGGQAQTFADSTAGGMERAKIKMGELKESIGYALMPVITGLTTFVADKLIPAVQAIADEWIPKLKTGFGAVRDVLGPVMDKLGPVVKAITENKATMVAAATVIGTLLVAAFVALGVAAWGAAAGVIAATWPFIAIAVAIGGVSAAIYLLVTHFGDIMDAFGKLPGLFNEAWGAVTGFFTETVPNWIKDNWPQILIGVFTGIPGLVLFHFRDKLWEIAQTDVLPFFTTTIPNWIKDNWPSLLVFALLGVPGLILYLFRDKLWAVFQSDVLPLFTDTIPNWFRDNWVPIVVTVLTGGAGTMIYAFRDTIATKVTEVTSSLLGAGKSMGKSILDGLLSGVATAGAVVTDIAAAVGLAVKAVINSLIDQINSALEFTIPGPGPLPDITVNPPDIPHLAGGGIVLGSRPMLALLHPPEAVIPLRQGTSALRSLVVNFNGPVLGDRADAERFASFLRDELGFLRAGDLT